ncbi:palmitoyl-acyl carrier protein thioesterase, chloroplastic-like [Rutidosis leptorrhynchoides]|uniref:palmitoyl-acyl carrier protein thioesterase, chloroplastic-like n=1 Tax=Rutidosis leptorrhynchoides TaxID=125765 RepID=UPI003A996B5C
MSTTTISCLQISSKHNIDFGYNLSSASKLRCKLDNVKKYCVSDSSSSSSLSMQAKSNKTKISDTYSSLSSATFGVRDCCVLLSEVLSGRMVSDNVFRQVFKIRSYETGPRRTALIDTLMKFIQEPALNHLMTTGLCDDMYTTPIMSAHNLIWVVTKLQFEVDRYPSRYDVVQVDHWKSLPGKNNMSCKWLLHDYQTGEILARALANWVVMNKETRRLSKFPDDVRAELAPYVVDTTLPIQEMTRKYNKKLNINDVVHVRNGLMATWNDLDTNQHVNNVKYTQWILESVPNWIMEKYELANMTLEYRRECTIGSLLQSQTFVLETDNTSGTVDCQHLLQFEGESSGVIMKGMTIWRPKRESFH